MREIRTSGLTRGSGRMALLRKRRLSLSTLLNISGFRLSRIYVMVALGDIDSDCEFHHNWTKSSADRRSCSGFPA
jgi:hypothetical protein